MGIVNSLLPKTYGAQFIFVSFQHIITFISWTFRDKQKDLTEDKSAMVQIVSPYVDTRSQWVNKFYINNFPPPHNFYRSEEH